MQELSAYTRQRWDVVVIGGGATGAGTLRDLALRGVKALLLDQRAVAGIGNIYSDEILFSCGIRPSRPCRSLTDAEWEKLAAAIQERLEYFIEKNSISFADYAAGGGKDYRNTPFLQVYGRGGEPCPGCGAPLARIVLGGRSSVFCPHCQK